MASALEKSRALLRGWAKGFDPGAVLAARLTPGGELTAAAKCCGHKVLRLRVFGRKSDICCTSCQKKGTMREIAAPSRHQHVLGHVCRCSSYCISQQVQHMLLQAETQLLSFTMHSALLWATQNLQPLQVV
jgi:hypothetical protein